MLTGSISKLDVRGIEEFRRLGSSEESIAILTDRLWPLKAKQDERRISRQCTCSLRKKRNERLNVGGVVIGSTEKRGCVSNDSTIKQASNEYALAPHGVLSPVLWGWRRLATKLIITACTT